MKWRKASSSSRTTNNIADLLRLYLEKEGYQATIAADGTQGIDLYRKLRPDLVLLDVMMPGVDGWGVLRAIRQDSQTPGHHADGQGRDDR